MCHQNKSRIWCQECTPLPKNVAWHAAMQGLLSRTHSHSYMHPHSTRMTACGVQHARTTQNRCAACAQVYTKIRTYPTHSDRATQGLPSHTPTLQSALTHTINKARQNVWAARTTPDCCAPAQVHTKRHNTHYNTCSPAYKTGLHHMLAQAAPTRCRSNGHVVRRA